MSTKGFTLIELLIVVAILGVLSAVAIPIYRDHMHEARRSEATISLSAIYNVETTFESLRGSYTACLAKIGYTPKGKRYYITGFDSVAASGSCGPTSTTTACSVYAWNSAGVATLSCASADMFSPATATEGGPVLTSSTALNAVTGVSTDSFLAGAIGQIGADCSDRWSIGGDKNIVHIADGTVCTAKTEPPTTTTPTTTTPTSTTPTSTTPTSTTPTSTTTTSTTTTSTTTTSTTTTSTTPSPSTTTTTTTTSTTPSPSTTTTTTTTSPAQKEQFASAVNSWWTNKSSDSVIRKTLSDYKIDDEKKFRAWMAGSANANTIDAMAKYLVDDIF